MDDYGLAHAQAMYDAQEPKGGFVPHCPVCGSECEELFFDKADELVACEYCVRKRDAFEYLIENK